MGAAEVVVEFELGDLFADGRFGFRLFVSAGECGDSKKQREPDGDVSRLHCLWSSIRSNWGRTFSLADWASKSTIELPGNCDGGFGVEPKFRGRLPINRNTQGNLQGSQE